MNHIHQKRINAMRLAAANFRKLGNDPLARLIDEAVKDLRLRYDPPVRKQSKEYAV